MLKLAETDRRFEYLDDPALPPETAARSLQDVALANRLFGGTRAILSEARATFQQQHAGGVRTLTLLDVGTGQGDIPVALAREAARCGIRLRAVGLELTGTMAAMAQRNKVTTVAGDARALPFPDRSIDVITCSLVLHHLDETDSVRMLRECARVARVRVVVADLRRSWLAVILFWMVSFPLRFHPFSRHDGVVSIRRGFTVRELQALVKHACDCNARCLKHLGWRVTAAWNPATTFGDAPANSTPITL